MLLPTPPSPPSPPPPVAVTRVVFALFPETPARGPVSASQVLDDSWASRLVAPCRSSEGLSDFGVCAENCVRGLSVSVDLHA